MRSNDPATITMHIIYVTVKNQKVTTKQLLVLKYGVALSTCSTLPESEFLVPSAQFYNYEQFPLFPN